jgi:hypothetical protein
MSWDEAVIMPTASSGTTATVANNIFLISISYFLSWVSAQRAAKATSDHSPKYGNGRAWRYASVALAVCPEDHTPA